MGDKNMKDLPACCMSMDINIDDLIFPDGMDERGKKFFDVYGVKDVKLDEIIKNSTDLGNGMIKINLRCKQLADNGLCKIYKDRPQICRDWSCKGIKKCSYCNP